MKENSNESYYKLLSVNFLKSFTLEKNKIKKVLHFEKSTCFWT